MLYKIKILLFTLLLLSSEIIWAGYNCTIEDNLFYSTNNSKWCEEKASYFNGTLAGIFPGFEKITSKISQCKDSFSLDVSSTKNLDDKLLIEKCQDLTSCFDAEEIERERLTLDSNPDSKKYYCTMESMKKIFDNMALISPVEESFSSMYSEDSTDMKLDQLESFLVSALPQSRLKDIHYCHFDRTVSSNCSNGLTGINMNIINNTKAAIALKSDLTRIQSNSSIQNLNRITMARRQQSNIMRQNAFGPLRKDAYLINFAHVTEGDNFVQDKDLPDVIRLTPSQTFIASTQKEKVRFGNEFNLFDKKKEQSFGFVLPVLNSDFSNSDLYLTTDISKAIISMLNFENTKDDYTKGGYGALFSFKDINYRDFDSALKNASDNVDKPLFIIDLANKIFEKHCNESKYYSYNINNVCSEIQNKSKTTLSIGSNNNYLNSISRFLDGNDKISKNINSKNLNRVNNTLFSLELNSFLSKRDKYKACVNRYKEKAFAGTNSNVNYKKYLIDLEKSGKFAAQSQERSAIDAQKLSLQQIKDIDPSAAKAFQEMEKKVDTDSKRLAETSSELDIGVKSYGIKSNINKSVDILPDAKINSNFKEMIPIVDTPKVISEDIKHNPIRDEELVNVNNKINNIHGDVSKYNSNSNSNELSSAFVDNSGSSSNTIANTNSAIESKLSEIEKKEQLLKEKISKESKNENQNAELKSLQKQIEDLKLDLEKSKNEMTKTKDENELNRINKSNTVNNSNSTKTNKTLNTNSDASFISPNNSIRSNPVGSINTNINIGSTEAPNSNSQNISSAQASASVSTNRSISNAIGSAVLKEANSVKSFGLVLTKSGELTEDLSKVSINPVESDIELLAEKSNGQPFIIQENGAFVQVSLLLNKLGKPVLLNGKKQYSKIKLSKNILDNTKEELNKIRDAKTIEDTYRLNTLKSAIDEAKK